MISETFQGLIERATFYAQDERVRSSPERRRTYPDVEEAAHALL